MSSRDWWASIQFPPFFLFFFFIPLPYPVIKNPQPPTSLRQALTNNWHWHWRRRKTCPQYRLNNAWMPRRWISHCTIPVPISYHRPLFGLNWTISDGNERCFNAGDQRWHGHGQFLQLFRHVQQDDHHSWCRRSVHSALFTNPIHLI